MIGGLTWEGPSRQIGASCAWLEGCPGQSETWRYSLNLILLGSTFQGSIAQGMQSAGDRALQSGHPPLDLCQGHRLCQWVLVWGRGQQHCS